MPLTRHAVHHDQGAVSDTESGGHLGGEVDVAGGVNQIDQEATAAVALLDEGHVLLTQLVEQGDGAVAGRDQKQKDLY